MYICMMRSACKLLGAGRLGVVVMPHTELPVCDGTYSNSTRSFRSTVVHARISLPLAVKPCKAAMVSDPSWKQPVWIVFSQPQRICASQHPLRIHYRQGLVVTKTIHGVDAALSIPMDYSSGGYVKDFFLILKTCHLSLAGKKNGAYVRCHILDSHS